MVRRGFLGLLGVLGLTPLASASSNRAVSLLTPSPSEHPGIGRVDHVVQGQDVIVRSMAENLVYVRADIRRIRSVVQDGLPSQASLLESRWWLPPCLFNHLAWDIVDGNGAFVFGSLQNNLPQGRRYYDHPRLAGSLAFVRAQIPRNVLYFEQQYQMPDGRTRVSIGRLENVQWEQWARTYRVAG